MEYDKQKFLELLKAPKKKLAGVVESPAPPKLPPKKQAQTIVMKMAKPVVMKKTVLETKEVLLKVPETKVAKKRGRPKKKQVLTRAEIQRRYRLRKKEQSDE